MLPHSLSLALALLLPLLAAAQNLTLNPPASSLCSPTNFTWTYDGITGAQALGMVLNLTLLEVGGANASYTPAPTLTTNAAGQTITAPAVAGASVSPSTRGVGPVSLNSVSTPTTTPTPVLVPTTPTALVLPSLTTVTIDGIVFTENAETVPTNVFLSTTGPAAITRRTITQSIVIPLTAGSVPFNPSGTPAGWYVLIAYSSSSDPSSPALSAVTAPFYITPACPVTQSPPPAASAGGLSAGAKAGIAIGVIAAVALLFILFILWRRRRSSKRRAPSSAWEREHGSGADPAVFGAAQGWNSRSSPDEKHAHAADVPLSPLASPSPRGVGASSSANTSARAVGGDHFAAAPATPRTPAQASTSGTSPTNRGTASATPSAAQDPFAGGDSDLEPSSVPSSTNSHLALAALAPPLPPSQTGYVFAAPTTALATPSPTEVDYASFLPNLHQSPRQSTDTAASAALQQQQQQPPSRRGSAQRDKAQESTPPVSMRRPPPATPLQRPMSEASKSATNLGLGLPSAAPVSASSPPSPTPHNLTTAPLQKSVSLTHPAGHPSRPTRKPVPAYRVDSFQPPPHQTQYQSHAGESDTSLPLGPSPADEFYHGPSRNSSGSGVDPALRGWEREPEQPTFAGQKEGRHVLMPDMPPPQPGPETRRST